jgi:hypothetical protein
MVMRASIQSGQRWGATTYDASAMRAVAARATARARHSRRKANQRTPTPGVTFVRSTKAQAAGQRKPATTAAPRRVSMLPAWRFKRTGGQSTTKGQQRETVPIADGSPSEGMLERGAAEDAHDGLRGTLGHGTY